LFDPAGRPLFNLPAGNPDKRNRDLLPPVRRSFLLRPALQDLRRDRSVLTRAMQFEYQQALLSPLPVVVAELGR